MRPSRAFIVAKPLTIAGVNALSAAPQRARSASPARRNIAPRAIACPPGGAGVGRRDARAVQPEMLRDLPGRLVDDQARDQVRADRQALPLGASGPARRRGGRARRTPSRPRRPPGRVEAGVGRPARRRPRRLARRPSPGGANRARELGDGRVLAGVPGPKSVDHAGDVLEEASGAERRVAPDARRPATGPPRSRPCRDPGRSPPRVRRPRSVPTIRPPVRSVDAAAPGRATYQAVGTRPARLRGIGEAVDRGVAVTGGVRSEGGSPLTSALRRYAKGVEPTGFAQYGTTPMQLAKFLAGADATPRVGLLEGRPPPSPGPGGTLSTDLLHAADSGRLAARERLDPAGRGDPSGVGPAAGPDRSPGGLGGGRHLRAEQGGAAGGVGAGAASFYDQVYRADRPELFFKATPEPGRRARAADPRPARHRAGACPSRSWPWCSSPDLRLVGFTVGNDVSARDIEGENPLYLPQAKVYDACCALGPGRHPGRGDAAGRTRSASAWRSSAGGRRPSRARPRRRGWPGASTS